jgi:hypothetical protein
LVGHVAVIVETRKHPKFYRKYSAEKISKCFLIEAVWGMKFYEINSGPI